MAAELALLDPPSPNHGPRRNGLKPRLVVLHYTGMASGRAAFDRLCDPAAEVSAHYLIGRDGAAVQLVPEEMRAWHAGAGSWGGMDDINSRSIGIEIDNPGDAPFPAPAMTALEGILAGVLERWEIPAKGVIAHSDMAPGRKTDPGGRFDWRALSLLGLAVWPVAPEPREPDGERFLREAASFGYPVETGFETVLDAFRLRFRPGITGPLDAVDMGLICDLAWRFPVDREAVSA